MLSFVGWAMRVGAVGVAVAAGVTLFAAAPEMGNRPPTAEEARCSYARSIVDPSRFNTTPPPDLAELTATANRYPPPLRQGWDPKARDGGLMLLAVAASLLIAGLLVGNAARREEMAAALLTEARKRDHG